MGKENLERIQVLGANLSNVLNAFGSFQLLASRIMIEEKLGMEGEGGRVHFDPNKWYPLTRWLGTFERIGREYGEKMLGQVGLAVPKNAVFPPFVRDIDSAIKSIDVAYHMNHALDGEPMYSPTTGEMREGIGHYGYYRVPGKRQIICECNNVYPCAFDQYLILAVAQRFEGAATVTHDPSKPCRKYSGQSCTYVVTW